MFKRKKNIKKVFLSAVLLLSIFTINSLYKQVAKGADLIPVTEEEAEPVPNLGEKGLQGPTLEVFFMKENNVISEGDKITAEAITSGFEQLNEKLYFTWYLKRENGESLDGDSDYDENDWKIEAARIIAQNGYSGGQTSASGSSDGNSDGHDAEPDWEADGTSSNTTTNCYVQDFVNGGVYELKQTKEYFKKESLTGDITICDEENGEEFICASSVESIDCSLMDPELPAKNACQEKASTPKCNIESVATFKTSLKCTSGVPYCAASGGTYSSELSASQLCDAIGIGSVGSTCTGLVDNESLSTLKSCTFTEKENGNLCRHLFPDADISGEELGDGDFGDEEEEFWGTDKNNESTAGNGVADEANVMGLGAEKFIWNYETGDKVGLVVEGESVNLSSRQDGKNMIMWAFSKNKCEAITDAVESRRFYRMDVAGMPIGILTIGDADNDGEVDLNLNDCLEENLIDPAVGGQSGYLDVSMFYAPNNPKNDPFIEGPMNKGDTVSVTANVANVANPQGLVYEWRVEGSLDGTGSQNDSNWIDKTSQLTETSNLSGIGNSNFQFKLNLKNDFFPNNSVEQYLRVKVRVIESGGSGRETTKTIIIKINQLGPEIVPYSVSVGEGGKLVTEESICNESNTGFDCGVSVNEIVGLRIQEEGATTFSNTSWKLNGVPVSCEATISTQCASNEAFFFPITGSVGDVIELSAEATNTATGLVQKFTKKFLIIEPFVRIVSEDENQAWPKEIGYFKNMDGSVSADLSDTVLQTVQGSEVILKADFNPDFMENPEKTTIKWFVDEEEKPSESSINFNVQKESNSFYNVRIEAEYVQPSEIRIALERFWGISAADSGEKSFENSIQLEVIPAEYAKIDKELGKKGFLANIISNMPSQALFMVRTVLTVALLIVFSGIMFSLIPDFKNRN